MPHAFESIAALLQPLPVRRSPDPVAVPDELAPRRHRLARAIRERRGDAQAIEQYLRDHVPSWERRAAHLALVGELGADQARARCVAAFGAAPEEPPAAEASAVPRAGLRAQHDLARARGWQELLLSLEGEEGSPALAELAARAEPHVLRAAATLLGAAGRTPPAFLLRPTRPELRADVEGLHSAVERRAATLMRQALAGAEADADHPAVAAALGRTAEGAALPDALRRRLEARLGVDLRRVRVHTDDLASEAARALRASAFTVGEEIFFQRGAWAPESAAGERLLLHELAHVAQAQAGRVGAGGGVSRPGDPLEQEAEALAESADGWARWDSVAARIQHVFGAIAEIPVEYASTRPGGAAAVTVDGRVHLTARGLRTVVDLARLGHEFAHALQQRRGPDGASVAAAERATLETEARAAGDAFARGEPFTVALQAPRGAPLYDGKPDLEALHEKEKAEDKRRVVELLAKLDPTNRKRAQDLVDALLPVDHGFVVEALETHVDKNPDAAAASRFFKHLYRKGVYRQEEVVFTWWARQAGVKDIKTVVTSIVVTQAEPRARLKTYLAGDATWQECFGALRYIEKNVHTNSYFAVYHAVPDWPQIFQKSHIPDVKSVRTIDDALELVDVWTVGVRTSIRMRKKLVSAYMARDRAEIAYAEEELDTFYSKTIGWGIDLVGPSTTANKLNRKLIEEKYRSLSAWQAIHDGKDEASKGLTKLVDEQLPGLRNDALATKEKLRGLEGKRGRDEATVKRVTQEAGKDFGAIKTKLEQLAPGVMRDMSLVYEHMETIKALHAETQEILARRPAGFFTQLFNDVAGVFGGFWDQMKKVDWIEVLEVALEIAGTIFTGGGLIVVKVLAWIAKLGVKAVKMIDTVKSIKGVLDALAGGALDRLKRLFTLDGLVQTVVGLLFGDDPLKGLPDVEPTKESDAAGGGGRDGLARLAGSIAQMVKHALNGFAKVTKFLRSQADKVNLSQKPWFRNVAGVVATLVQAVEVVRNPAGVIAEGVASLRGAVDGFFGGVVESFKGGLAPVQKAIENVLDPSKLFETLLHKAVEWVINLIITDGPSATLSAALRGVQSTLGEGKTLAGEILKVTILGEPVGEFIVSNVSSAVKDLPGFSDVQRLAQNAGGFLTDLTAGFHDKVNELRSVALGEMASGAKFLGDFLGIKIPTGDEEAGGDGKKVQRSAEADHGGPLAVDGGAERALASSSGRPLEPGVRGRMEEQFGRDFSSVRVHTDGPAAEAASGLSAHALTQGSDIYFAAGAYRPGSRAGDELLAHELTHVVQQDASGATVRAKRTTSAAGDAAEQQADRVARGVVDGDASAAREVSPRSAGAGALHRKSAGAKKLKDDFRARLVAFGRAVRGWDAAVRTTHALVGDKASLKQFIERFVKVDQTAGFVMPLGADHAKFLAELRASLAAGKLPSKVQDAVNLAQSTIAKKLPAVEKGSERTAVQIDTWKAFQYLYGVATLSLVASGKERGDAPGKRDLGKVEGFEDACTTVQLGSETTSTSKLMVFQLGVPARQAELKGSYVYVTKPTGGAPVEEALREDVQKRADTRYDLIRKSWIKDVAAYSDRKDKVLDRVVKGWDPKEVGDKRLKLVDATAQTIADKHIKKGDIEDHLRKTRDPRSLGFQFLNPLAGDLITRVQDGLKGKHDEDRSNVQWDPTEGGKLVGKLTIGKGEATADLNLKALVKGATLGDEDGVVAFMLILARDGHITVGKTTLTFEEFNDASGKHPMSFHNSTNGKWVKDEFRAADADAHEWIPSDMIADVVAAALKAPKKDRNPWKWVYAQHLARTLTRMIVFNPSQGWLDDNPRLKVKLAGHVGALYLVRKDEDEEPYASPQIGKQGTWHDECRRFVKTHLKPETVLENLREFAFEHVWNGKLGELDPDQKVNYTNKPMERLKDDEGRKIMTVGQLAKRQEGYHAEIQTTFHRAMKTLAKYDQK